MIKIFLNKTMVIDAVRTNSMEKFKNQKDLRSGNIKNSFCIPFKQCLNKDKTFKSQKNSKVYLGLV